MDSWFFFPPAYRFYFVLPATSPILACAASAQDDDCWFLQR
jgi:hypothetical protein